MEVLGTIAAFIGILVVLVLVHELGHFIVAKRAGITVEEFGIGFPPRIGSVMYRGTILNAADEVAVGAFLLGRIPFPAIATSIADAVDRWGDDTEPDLATIVDLDAEVRASLERQLH